MTRVEDGSAGVRIITLARGEKRNALTTEMLDALRAAVEGLSGARAVAVLGEGRVFCAGFDLMLSAGDESLAVLRAQLSGLSAVVRAWRACPVPVVLCVQGAALAGGCALLGGADVVVVERRAQLGYPALRLGLSPAVSAPFLRLSVGDGAARGLMLAQRLITGEEAVTLGLAHEAVDGDDRARARALELAEGLARKPAGAMARTKAWLAEAEGLAARDVERALAASLDSVGHETFDLLGREVWNR